MPTPPGVVIAPVVVEVELVVVFTNKFCDISVCPSVLDSPLDVVNTWASLRYAVPATYKFCPILTSRPMPTPPGVVIAPVVVEVELVVVFTNKSCDISVRPSVLDNPLDVVNTWALLRYAVPPTYKSPRMPTPPATCRAPVTVETALVVFVIVNMPENGLPPPVGIP